MKHFSDGATVTDSKLATFLDLYVSGKDEEEHMRRTNVLEHFRVEGRSTKQTGTGVYRRRNKSKKTEWSRELYLGFVKAITSLYNDQVALKTNPHPHPRGHLTKTFLNTFVKKTTEKKRENFEDRGKNLLNDGYTQKEMVEVSKYFLNNASPLSARNRLVFLMSHAMLLRSQNATGMQLADLFCMEIEDQGISECIAVVASISWGVKPITLAKPNMDLVFVTRMLKCALSTLSLYISSRYITASVLNFLTFPREEIGTTLTCFLPKTSLDIYNMKTTVMYTTKCLKLAM